MLVGCSYQSNPNLSAPNAKSEDLGLFIRIAKDNSITIINMIKTIIEIRMRKRILPIRITSNMILLMQK